MKRDPNRPKASDIPERALLAACRDRSERNGPAPINALSAYPEKVVCAKLQKLLSRDLIEYGTSIGGSWLTEKGRARLAELEARDRAIGYQYNCYVCLAFIEFVPAGQQPKNSACPNGCTIPCVSPRAAGVIRDLKP